MYSELNAGALSETSATKAYKLGELRVTTDRTYGTRIWRYVQNKSGGALAAGEGVMQENGTDLYQVGLGGAATARVRAVGVAQHAIASDYFGWVLKSGRGSIKASATGILVNASQMLVATGPFEAGTIGTNEIIAHSMEAKASGLLALALIDCGG